MVDFSRDDENKPIEPFPPQQQCPGLGFNFGGCGCNQPSIESVSFSDIPEKKYSIDEIQAGKPGFLSVSIPSSAKLSSSCNGANYFTTSEKFFLHGVYEDDDSGPFRFVVEIQPGRTLDEIDARYKAGYELAAKRAPSKWGDIESQVSIGDRKSSLLIYWFFVAATISAMIGHFLGY